MLNFQIIIDLFYIEMPSINEFIVACKVNVPNWFLKNSECRAYIMNSSFVTSPSSSALSDNFETSCGSTDMPCSLKENGIQISCKNLYETHVLYSNAFSIRKYFTCVTYLNILTYSATDIFPLPFLSAKSNNSAIAFVCLRSFKLFPTIKAAMFPSKYLFFALTSNKQ